MCEETLRRAQLPCACTNTCTCVTLHRLRDSTYTQHIHDDIHIYMRVCVCDCLCTGLRFRICVLFAKYYAKYYFSLAYVVAEFPGSCSRGRARHFYEVSPLAASYNTSRSVPVGCIDLVVEYLCEILPLVSISAVSSSCGGFLLLLSLKACFIVQIS